MLQHEQTRARYGDENSLLMEWLRQRENEMATLLPNWSRYPQKTPPEEIMALR